VPGPTPVATGAVLQAFAEVPNQTRTSASAFVSVVLYRLNSCLRLAATLFDRAPVDGTTLWMQLTTEALRRLENVARNTDCTITLVPDALQQSALGEGDIELPPVQLSIGRTPQQHASGEFTIPTRSACLLVIGFGGRRRSPVHHQPD
jgi:hypothetical protein